MVAELIAWHRLTAHDIPFESFDYRFKVTLEHRSKAQQMWNPTECRWPVLQDMRIHRDTQNAIVVIERGDSPGHARCAATMPSDIKIVADPVMPMNKTALVHPAAEIMHLISRSSSRPVLDGITFAERMTFLEISGHRYSLPHPMRWRRDQLF